ncbi:hypothetical protein D3C78_1191870 [compost metagenome]
MQIFLIGHVVHRAAERAQRFFHPQIIKAFYAVGPDGNGGPDRFDYFDRFKNLGVDTDTL